MAGFPTQDSVHTESLSMVPHATDGSGFANSMVILLVNQRDLAFCYLVRSFSHQIDGFPVLPLATQGYLKQHLQVLFKYLNTCFLPDLPREGMTRHELLPLVPGAEQLSNTFNDLSQTHLKNNFIRFSSLEFHLLLSSSANIFNLK